MRKLFVTMFLIVSAAVLTSPVHAADFKEGVHYRMLAQQSSYSDKKIEVQEFFWYGCPHCYTFEPFINAWKKTKPANVEFVRVPTVFRPDWEAHARAYYALSNMNVIEEIHGKIFAAIHKDKKRLNKLETLADFVEKNGINKDKFISEYNSFAVDGLVRKVKKKQSVAELKGVPSVVVSGKYLTSGSMAGSYENLIKIINYLIEKESK